VCSSDLTSGYRFRELIVALVTSELFLHKPASFNP